MSTTLEPDERNRPVTLGVDYVRPIPADSTTVEVEAEVTTRTRRYALVEGAVHLPDGKLAARVRMSSEIDRST